VGRIGYLPVLDALRTLAQVEQNVAAAESRVAADQVNLFLALGGGWADADQPKQ
jgi:outer membrane protein TolC